MALTAYPVLLNGMVTTLLLDERDAERLAPEILAASLIADDEPADPGPVDDAGGVIITTPAAPPAPPPVVPVEPVEPAEKAAPRPANKARGAASKKE